MTGHRRDGSLATGHLGLATDLYELRMVQSYLSRGMTAPATFSLFIRPSAARPWYIALGTQRVVQLLEEFSYGDAELAYLAELGIDDRTCAWLGELTIDGELWAVPDGTVVLAQEPILELTAPLPVAQLLETAVMNLVHYPTLIATKAARCALAAQDRKLADFGFRRAHGLETGVEAALAAYVGGGFATSNVEAGRRYGIPVTGTMAHSYVQAFVDEQAAFRAFAEDHPDNSILLVDTYDTPEGVRRAIAACTELGLTPKGVRLDSGDLGELARTARSLLDQAGFTESIIIASGGVDEYRIHDMVTSGAPIDGFGVGTALTSSSDQPALDIAYKLVDYDGRAVAKFSGAKSTFPGPKQVYRAESSPVDDVLDVRGPDCPVEGLLEPVWRAGDRSLDLDLDAVRARVSGQLDALPTGWRAPPYPREAPTPALGDALQALTDEVRRAASADDGGT